MPVTRQFIPEVDDRSDVQMIGARFHLIDDQIVRILERTALRDIEIRRSGR